MTSEKYLNTNLFLFNKDKARERHDSYSNFAMQTDFGKGNNILDSILGRDGYKLLR